MCGNVIKVPTNLNMLCCKKFNMTTKKAQSGMSLLLKELQLKAALIGAFFPALFSSHHYPLGGLTLPGYLAVLAYLTANANVLP